MYSPCLHPLNPQHTYVISLQSSEPEWPSVGLFLCWSPGVGQSVGQLGGVVESQTERLRRPDLSHPTPNSHTYRKRLLVNFWGNHSTFFEELAKGHGILHFSSRSRSKLDTRGIKRGLLSFDVGRVLVRLCYCREGSREV
jgi:hypothetical protein